MHFFVHHSPGRLRIRLPSIARREDRIGELRRFLTQFPGISTIEIRRLTGSVIVTYEPSAVCARRIVSKLLESGWLLPGTSPLLLPPGRARPRLRLIISPEVR